MILTKIEQQKSNPNRYSIFIDEEFKFGISDIDVLYYKLKEGEELTEERYYDIMENVVYTKAKDIAFNYIGYKPRTEKEVVNKLVSKEYGSDIINRVIDMLKNYGYIDDSKYAAQYVAEKIRSMGGSKTKLAYELRKRGISDEIIENTFDETSFCEEETALKLLEKRLKGNRDLDFKEKRRVFGYLARRGFSYETIQSAFDKYNSLFY